MNRNFKERLFYNGILSNNIAYYISDGKVSRQQRLKNKHLTGQTVKVFLYHIYYM